MDFRTLVAERGHGVRAMARSLLPITGSGQASKHFYDSMIFLFTNAYEDGERVEAESIIQIAKTQFSEQKQLFKIFCQRRTDVDAQAIVDDPDFAEHTALLTFLETLSEATGRVHVCFPDTPEKSDRQRVAVQKMIEGSKPITRRVLGEIVSTRPTGNLEVCRKLEFRFAFCFSPVVSHEIHVSFPTCRRNCSGETLGTSPPQVCFE